MALPILKLSPHFAARPWGGQRLRTHLGKNVPIGQRTGESWELSDHPEGPSRIAGGPLDGLLFGEVLRAHPVEMIGRDSAPAKYPLLIKYIDAAEDLSIQVHPDDAYTERHLLADRGKTECWYVMDCDPGAEIIYGLKAGMTREKLDEAISTRCVPEVIERVPLSPGTFLFVPPGTVHAILAGTLLCEIQQSSNLTYRLWDWDRKPERDLHIRESLDVIDYTPAHPHRPFRLPPIPSGGTALIPLVENLYFEVKAVQLGPYQRLELSQPGLGLVLNGVEGNCLVNSIPLRLGDTFFVPACVGNVEFAAGDAPATVLASRSFE
jgi:mannose-6-phosphate isomerase